MTVHVLGGRLRLVTKQPAAKEQVKRSANFWQVARNLTMIVMQLVVCSGIKSILKVLMDSYFPSNSSSITIIVIFLATCQKLTDLLT